MTDHAASRTATLLDRADTRAVSTVTAMTRETDATRAAAALTAQLHRADMALEAVLFFCAADYDLPRLGAALQEALGSTRLTGCTTAGEIGPEGYSEDGIVAIGFAAHAFIAELCCLRDLTRFRIPDAGHQITALRREVDRRTDQDEAWRHCFAFVMFDAMAQREETVITLVSRALGSIPLLGGSAGDGLRFERTFVFDGERFVDNSAIVLLMRTKQPIRPFMSQHFTATETKMVVTAADPAQRLVLEINAEPAADEYARLIGVSREDLAPPVFATYPLMVRIGGRDYIRAIQGVQDNGALHFHCAIDNGIVLTVARTQDQVAALHGLFEEIRNAIGEPEIILGCDCVLRRLEAEQRQIKHIVSRLMRDNAVVGFNSFGEQYISMHVNQTFTGIAIGRGRGES